MVTIEAACCTGLFAGAESDSHPESDQSGAPESATVERKLAMEATAASLGSADTAWAKTQSMTP